MFELTATTEPARASSRLAEALADELATRAAEHDRERRSRTPASTRSSARGYFAAPIPAEHGGLGVTSVHDVVVASSRLARGDASVAIGVNMHLVILMNIVRRWQMAVAAGDARRAGIFAASMESIARDGVVIAAAISELGQDLTRPADDRDAHRVGLAHRRAQVVLHDVAGRDRALHGRHLPRRRRRRALRLRPGADRRRRASRSAATGTRSACAPRAATRSPSPASRSRAPRCRAASSPATPTPTWSATSWPASSTPSASLGIAESAASAAAAHARRARRARPARADAAGRERVELGAAGATLVARRRAGRRRRRRTPLELFAETQVAKTFVNEARARIVDRALALSGGAGYLNGHPLSRAYRDVRAGALHAPARRQPRLRPARRRRARPRAGPALAPPHRSGDPMSTQAEPIVDAAELRGHIRAMYRDVAREPDGDFHFELGRPVAERLGYPADWLDAVPADALASFAGVGHMLDLAAIEPRRHDPRPRLGLGHRRLRRRAPDRARRAASSAST